jgi:hypothetical protein
MKEQNKNWSAVAPRVSLLRFGKIFRKYSANIFEIMQTSGCLGERVELDREFNILGPR